MCDFVVYWVGLILQHVPVVTWVGLLVAGGLLTMWFTKRWASAPVLALAASLYAVSPYVHSF